ncbi:TetR/AcrR family transcriptional regulator [Rhodobacteraceae bacterium KMM 6894]|nr:TetR/AcrR family transcriptional regulator [Rhodobacteraceae bacterium KMM 6894]
MESEAIKPRRHAAGHDPAKREAILNGAARVFMDSGFDAASVNDICRVAGVSKSTMYVYFTSKEDLFEALMDRERDRVFKNLEEILSEDQPLKEKLYNFTFAFAKMLCSTEIIRAQRTVIAMAERMPELCARFYDNGPLRMRHSVERFLEDETADGTLEVQDTVLASHQLIELSTAGLWRQCLFGRISVPPPEETITATSKSAVDAFLSMYAKR